MSDPDLDQVGTELQHAREEDTGEVNEPLNNLTQALERLDEEGSKPKLERLDSITTNSYGSRKTPGTRSASTSDGHVITSGRTAKTPLN